MEDAEKLENEVSQLLNGLEEVERLLTSNRNRAYIEKEVSNFSSQIVSNSKTIDYLLNKTDLFDEPSEELDEKLRQLEMENRKTQTQFEQVKLYTGNIDFFKGKLMGFR